jgi:hypothetical protein
MIHTRAVRLAACLAVACAVLAGPVSGAPASEASIKAVIKSYNPKILVAEGHLLSAIGEFKSTGDPVPVQAALAQSIAVLRQLESKIAAQRAVRARVKRGKAKLVRGLKAVILAYEQLSKAFGEQKASPEAAAAEAAGATTAVRRGRTELREGAKLLR